LIGLVFDVGPSAFRCPICKTLYIIDPLTESDIATEGADFSVAELEGHRVEIYYGKGKIAQQTHADYQVAWSFFTPKIGNIENAYIAGTYSEPGKGTELLSQLAGTSQGAQPKSAPSSSLQGRKRLLSRTSTRIVLLLILLLACVAATIAIYVAVIV
jgi:hypothetical protein